MLDSDLSQLYGVETKLLTRAVRRNAARFPEDFMFQLTADEHAALRIQFGTSNLRRGGRRYPPYAFTEHGVVMLSSVLQSARAIAVNIEIVRAFVRLREMLGQHVVPEALYEPQPLCGHMQNMTVADVRTHTH